jgi:RNA polymerase sigma-70 factor (ECF subfamily)
MTLNELGERAREGDQGAWEEIYRHQWPGLMQCALKFLHNHQDAEDIVQEAFAKAYLKIRETSGTIHTHAWLQQIVQRKCIDTIRHRRVIRMYSQPFNTGGDELPRGSRLMEPTDDDSRVDPESAAVDGALAELVEATIRRGSDVNRDTALLVFLYGWMPHEAGKAVGIERKAARSRVLRSRDVLKTAFRIRGWAPEGKSNAEV